MKSIYTLEELQAMMDKNGYLDLEGTQITSLPEGLTVGGNLDLQGTQITSLPEGLTVGGNLYLRGTQITSLPEGLTVGGSLYLRGTQITSLPEGLTVGGSLYLRGTQITSLPEGLTVGGNLYLRGTQINNPDHYKCLKNGDYKSGKYLFADGILTHVRSKRTVGEYTYYNGKIKNRNVISDGTHYAHCANLRDGIADILFKNVADRGADQYKRLKLNDTIIRDEGMAMYRIITGACKQGTQSFVDGLKEPKDEYTIREIIELTKGQYNANRLKEFFEIS